MSFEWTPGLDKLFNETKTSLSKDAELAILNSTHLFYFTGDAFLIGLGAIMFKPNPEIKRKSYLIPPVYLQLKNKSFYLRSRNLCYTFRSLSI